MDQDEASGGRPDGSSTADPNADASFEEVLTRLQSVVERLEEGDMPLEESLARFEEGVHLSRLGARRLDEAERRVEELLESDGNVQTRTMESDAGSDEGSGRRSGRRAPRQEPDEQ